MHSNSRAPLLSATLSRDSCWIIGPAPRFQRPASAWSWRADAFRRSERYRPPWRRRHRHGRGTASCSVQPCHTAGDASTARSRRGPSGRGRRTPQRRLSSCVWHAPRPSLTFLFRGPLLRGPSFEFLFPDHRGEPGDIFAHLAEACGVVQLVGGELETQVEELLLGFLQPLLQLLPCEVAQVDGFHVSSRITNLVLMGS